MPWIHRYALAHRRGLQRLAKATIAVGIVLLVGGTAFVEYSMTPEFCNSCHIMKPFYAAWRTSTHNFVPCVECHYTPGIKSEIQSKYEALSQVAKYITRTYGPRPRAEIQDESCLREGCHTQRLLQGKVRFGVVTFDHRPHLVELRRGQKLRCTSCHSQIVQGTHMTVTQTTCFLCHFKAVPLGESISRCTACHTAPRGEVERAGVRFDHAEMEGREVACVKCHVAVVRGGGEVPRERCGVCHGEPERLARYDDVTFVHTWHVTQHKVDCQECHNVIEHGLVEMASTLQVECTSCHPDHHVRQRELYMGIGGKGVAARPNAMFLARVGCNGCHLVHRAVGGKEIAVVASEAACISCHGTAFQGMLDEWLRVVERAVGEMRPILAAARAAVGERDGKGGVGAARDSLQRAESNLALVEGGHGVHNVSYSLDLLAAAYRQAAAAMRIAGALSIPRRPDFLDREGSEGGECRRCHAGIQAMGGQAFGREVPHAPHLRAGLPCARCHGDAPYGTEGHGRLLLAVGECQACHHARGAGRCGECHPLQAAFVRGGPVAGVRSAPSPMAEAVPCEGCHGEGARGETTRASVREACIGCHEEGYGEILDTWMRGGEERLAAVEGLVARAPSTPPERVGGWAAALRSEGSMGIHNPELAGALADSARTLLEGAVPAP